MLARQMALGPEAFAWHPVSTDVNYAGRDGAHLIEPLAEPMPEPLHGEEET
jgi:hypothetical protein